MDNTVSGTDVTIVSVGTCTVTASQAGNTNYNAAPQLSENITINKADITAKASNKSRAYGEANPTFTVTYTGLVNGDSTLTTPPTLSTTADTSQRGDYDIICSINTDANYNLTNCTDGKLTITKTDATTIYNSDNT